MKTGMNLKEGGDASSRFFRVILGNDLQDPVQLGIPTKFVMKHGNDLPDLVCLRVPGGDAWEVMLRKKNGKVWLRDGWADFMKHYEISHGHFLVFNYLGESRFDVVILDVTACEIEYPIKPDLGRRSRHANKPLVVPDSEEVVDRGFQPRTRRGNKRKKKFPTHGPRPSKITKMALKASLDSQTAKRDSRQPSGKVVAERSANERRSPRRPVDSTVGDECPSFEVVICKSSAQGNFLHIPNSFTRSHLQGAQALNKATLKYAHRSWPIELKDYGSRSTRSYRMKGCWGKFTRDSDLQTRDVCIFRLIDTKQLVFEVSISKHE